MMKMVVDIDWDDFDCTEQARGILDTIEEKGKTSQLENLINEKFTYPPDADEVADWLHNEWEDIYKELEITEEEEEE